MHFIQSNVSVSMMSRCSLRPVMTVICLLTQAVMTSHDRSTYVHDTMTLETRELVKPASPASTVVPYGVGVCEYIGEMHRIHGGLSLR